MGAFPVFILRPTNIERTPGNAAEKHIVLADPEFVPGVAHRGTAIAAASRLVKQQITVNGLEPLNQGCRRIGYGYTFNMHRLLSFALYHDKSVTDTLPGQALPRGVATCPGTSED
jgi:hypothetical protein